jgi:hypothetical protein
MSRFKPVWCRAMHRDIAYGGGGVYWCRRCLCRFPVPWVPAPNGKAQDRPTPAISRREFANQPVKAVAA